MKRLTFKVGRLVAGTLACSALMILGLAYSSFARPGASQAVHSWDAKSSEGSDRERLKQAIAPSRQQASADKLLAEALMKTGWRQTERTPEGAAINLFLYSNNAWVIYSSRPNGLWFIVDKGNSWTVANGELTLESDGTSLPPGSPLVHRDRVKLSPPGELSFLTKTWQKLEPQANRSARQLAGTWVVKALRKYGNHYGPAFSNSSTVLELNSDGTWRRKTLSDYSIAIQNRRESGTWSYENFGLYDGTLILKNPQGEIISIGAITWAADGSQFTHVQRAERERETGNLKDMGRQVLIPTDLTID